MVDEMQRAGKDILSATDDANKAFGFAAASEGDEVAVPSEADNQRALAELEAQMRGVRG